MMTDRKAEFCAYSTVRDNLAPLRKKIADQIDEFIAERQKVAEFLVKHHGFSMEEAIDDLPTVPGAPRPRKSANGQPGHEGDQA